MELKAADEEQAEKMRREQEAQRAYDEELQRLLDKAKTVRVARISRL